jgi:hypothetical protein
MSASFKAPQDAVSLLRRPGTKAQGPSARPSQLSEPAPAELAPAPAHAGRAAKKTYVPFSSRLTPEHQQALEQLAYWSRTAKVDILEAALAAYFAAHPDSQTPLPDTVRR